MSALMFHLLVFDSLYSKLFIKYLISLDGWVVLANFGITGPKDISFIVITFLRYIFQLLDLMNQTSFLETQNLFYFNNERKEIYLSLYVSFTT